jgi:hypothetical protein
MTPRERAQRVPDNNRVRVGRRDKWSWFTDNTGVALPVNHEWMAGCFGVRLGADIGR